MQQKILLESGTNEMEILIVDIGGQKFGINVDKVVTIKQRDSVQPAKLPKSKPGISGVFEFRDEPINLINLCEILNIKSVPQEKGDLIIVTKFNGITTGFQVNNVDKITRQSWENFEPINLGLDGQNFVTGTIFVNGENVLVLDLEHILGNITSNFAIKKIKSSNTVRSKDTTILFAEDSSLIRGETINNMKKAGFKNIKAFTNGKELSNFFTEEVKHKKMDTDSFLVVTDIEMPQLDGFTLCKNIKSDPYLKNIPVVIFSSLINEQIAEKCNSVGADNYISKPESEMLVNAIDALI